MAISNGVQAIHSIDVDVVDVVVVRRRRWRPAPAQRAAVSTPWPAELRGRLAEGRALVQPQQVAGGEHGADGGDDHQRAEQRQARARQAAGCRRDRIAGNSPQNPARPGRPSDAIAQKPRIQPSRGIWMSMPLSRLISSVW